MTDTDLRDRLRQSLLSRTLALAFEPRGVIQRGANTKHGSTPCRSPAARFPTISLIQKSPNGEVQFGSVGRPFACRGSGNLHH